MICQEEDIVRYAVVEKANHRAVHEVFDTRERAEAFIAGIIPLYVAHGLYVDKTLRKDSFEVIPYWSRPSKLS